MSSVLFNFQQLYQHPPLSLPKSHMTCSQPTIDKPYGASLKGRSSLQMKKQLSWMSRLGREGGKSEEQHRGTGLDHPSSVFLEGLTTERFPKQVNFPWLWPGASLIRQDNGLPQISPFLHNVCQQTLGIRSHGCLLSICAFQSVKADTPLVDPRLIEKFLSF